MYINYYKLTCDIFGFIRIFLIDFKICLVRSIRVEWHNRCNGILIKPTNMSMINEIIRTQGILSTIILLITTLRNKVLIRINFLIIPIIRKWSLLMISPINKLILITTAISKRNIRLMFLMIRVSQFCFFVQLFRVGFFIR